MSTNTYANGKGGSLTIHAQNVELSGESVNGHSGSALLASAQPNSTGDAGNLTINTHNLLVRDGAFVNAINRGVGKGGSLTINAQNVQLIGEAAKALFGSGLKADTNQKSTGAGDAGDLIIKTHTLLVRDGAFVSASTSGAGKGGNLIVDAQEVQLIGESANIKFGTGLLAGAFPNSTGDAGDLTINTHTLLVRDGAIVSTSTSGGKGGSLMIHAHNVQLIGTRANKVGSSLLAAAFQNSTGDAGDLTIKTNTLLVQDGAGISVQSLGSGTAGNMTLNARSIRLNNNAFLRGNTQSPKVVPNRQQATININSQDLIMSRNSKITTDARGENVIGGNININTDFLIGFKNSDISAKSANFQGGNVRIKAQGIFGTQRRDVESNSTSDITATGGRPELSGTVEIKTPDINPASRLIKSPTDIVDVSRLIGQDFCRVVGQNSEFVVTGRGGLPSSPNETLRANAPWEDLRLTQESELASPQLPSANRIEQQKTKDNQPQRIVEAQGWISAPNGSVLLTAKAVTVTPQGLWLHPLDCQLWKQTSRS